MFKVNPLVALGALALLGGCTSYAWIKPGGDPATFPADSYACKQESLAAAPPVFQTYTPAPPGAASDVVKTDCVNDGPVQHCRSRVVPGYQPPPRTVDLNERTRDDFYAACLNARGWFLRPIEKPE